ncbi:PQQ-dependent dehydrogenase, methanol/ethanol family [Salipiger sp. P9]|uniref:PQQ-dependent dehydrogenase, methanol/ethanol family n=1 Tax=Salipiger pentaromativorans TaxID=2943193 RepID=UPI002158853D|nr:PQQ-dependent dehydrogenase, methanol/ethanol family [Salipiger pentaromativorans]MCR8550644.1 PQQ-dependent dehydrogenase, methanol/ethanol family [Salipiger pentaromativorans]
MQPFKRLAVAVTLAALAGPVCAQSADDLARDAATTDQILTYGMGYGQQRYSTLDQINTETVAALAPAWTLSLANEFSNETFPLLHDGILYVTTHDATVAIDAVTGRQLWKSFTYYPTEATRVLCCGVHNRGAAIYEGMLFRGTPDAHVVALDLATGDEIWRAKSEDYKLGYNFTAAPQIADGVVILPVAGGDYGIRGYIDGYDAKTGERLWRTYTIPGPGEPGHETWEGGGDAWKHGGGGGWITGSFDPELHTLYIGTGNATPYNASVRPGDNLYTSSVLALDPKTGAIKWHYQFSPHDPFDYDAMNEMVLADIDGQKVLMHANKNGFLYVLDRTDGTLLAANPFQTGDGQVTWATGIDLETGRPIVTDVYDKVVAGEEADYAPGSLGGKNYAPMSYNPQDNLVYINTLIFPMTSKPVEPEYIAGTMYLGVEMAFHLPEDGHNGDTVAIDPMTGEVAWIKPAETPRWSGLLSTAGGLVFTGETTGEFAALDAATGETLWSYQTGSAVNGQPITWEKDGRQYVTVGNGGGAAYELYSGDERLSNVPAGANIWTFALPEAR